MSKIKQIWQPINENILVVRYYSGAIRYCYLDDSYYIMTATQRAFIDKATRTETESGTIWK